MAPQTRFLALANEARKSIQELSVEQVRRKIQDGDQFLLIDIREPAEWLQGHIGALHLGRGVLERDIEGIADPHTPIVLYCGGGLRSALATLSLQKMGYAQVFCLLGGYAAWCKTPQNHGFVSLVKEAAIRVRVRSAEEVRLQQIDRPDSFAFIDVREGSEWRKGYVPGSMHVPRGILENLIESKVPNIHQEIVLFCGAGQRSTLAAESLANMGYTDVFVMKGGLRAWREKKFPVEKPRPG